MTRRRKLALVILIPLLCVLAVLLLRPYYAARIDSFAECSKAGFPVQETDPPTCNDGRQTYVGPRGTPLPSMEAIQELDYQVLVEGDSRGSYPAKNQVITTQTEWASYWSQVHQAISPQPNIIPVDFTKNDVLALNLGPEPNTGFLVKLLSLVSVGSSYKADIQIREPGKNCSYPAKPSGPYYIALIPKMSGPVAFNVNRVTQNCPS